MQPQNETPPPAQNTDNPYDFLNGAPQAKPSLIPTGNSKKQRIIIVGIGAFMLVVFAIIVLAILSSTGGGPKEDLLSLAQQQEEIVRITDIGLKKANQSDTKSLAVTTKFTVTSQQNDVQALTKKAGVKIEKKQLQAGKDTKTDDTLTAAEQSNQFDTVFTNILKTKLLAYRRSLNKVQSEIGNKKSRQTLQAYQRQISIIFPDEATPASQ